MDRHAEWIKAQYELSEASKLVHHWDAMSADLRSRMTVKHYRAKRAEARQRFRQADRLCRDVGKARRMSMSEERRT